MILLNKLVLFQVISHPLGDWPELDLMVAAGDPQKGGGAQVFIA